MVLSELKPGQRARIIEIREEELSLKLLEMGFLPGEMVECRFHAPSGDPTAYAVGSCLVALRYEEAAQVKITDFILE